MCVIGETVDYSYTFNNKASYIVCFVELNWGQPRQKLAIFPCTINLLAACFILEFFNPDLPQSTTPCMPRCSAEITVVCEQIYM